MLAKSFKSYFLLVPPFVIVITVTVFNVVMFHTILDQRKLALHVTILSPVSTA